MKHIMRTSDRNTFKDCRRKWHILSPTRLDLEPVSKPIYLDFGTSFHKGLETYYDPDTWSIPRETIEPLAIAAFVQEMKTIRAQGIDLSGQEPNDEQDAEYEKHLDLGQGMLRYYFTLAKHDTFTPVMTEIEFEVPILHCQSDGTYNTWGQQAGCPTCGEELWYQGRVDMIVKDSHGYYWIWDHKTTGQMSSLAYLDYDAQITSYCWALRRELNIDIRGFIYAQFLKDYPEPPAILKSPREGRKVSVNKMQRTTYELYLKTLQEQGENPNLYSEMLQFLQEKENSFFRRVQITRNETELENCGRDIYLESQDFFDHDVSIYPAPGFMKCGMCWTKDPCLMMNKGMDYEYTLKTLFRKRERADV